MANCQKNDNVLALAFNNRSVCLFSLGRYEDAVVDCGRALKSNYPREKIYKIFQRRGTCYYNIRKLAEALADFDEGLKAIAQLKKESSSPAAPDILASEKQLNEFKAKTNAELQRMKNNKKGGGAKISPSHDTKFRNPTLAHAGSVRLGDNGEGGVEGGEGRGRYLVATKEIAIGEDVVQEEAYAGVLMRGLEAMRCHHCWKEALLIPYVCACCSAHV